MAESPVLQGLELCVKIIPCLVLMTSIFVGQGLRDPQEPSIGQPEARVSISDGTESRSPQSTCSGLLP